MKLYVGNLPWSTNDSDLDELFGSVGPVSSAQVVMDRDSGRSRGFGFVEMAKEDGVRAIAKFNGHDIDGRALKVDEASERQPRNSGGSF